MAARHPRGDFVPDILAAPSPVPSRGNCRRRRFRIAEGDSLPPCAPASIQARDPYTLKTDFGRGAIQGLAGLIPTRTDLSCGA